MKLPVNYDNLTQPERKVVRETYARRQHGLCVHCNGYLSRVPPKFIEDKWVDEKLFPRGFLTRPIHLHHNHNTGMTIGAVHARCNAVLWQYHGE